MKRSVGLWIGAWMCFAVSARASSWDKLDAALSELARRAGTTVDRLRVDPAASALENDRIGTLRLEKYLMAEPQRAPATVDAMSRSLTESHGVAPRLDVLAALSWDRPAVPRPLNIDAVKLPGDTTSNPIIDAMERLYAGTGKRFQGKERAKVIEDARRFPRELELQVASLIDALTQASRMREAVVKSSELKQGGVFEGKSRKTANLLRDFLNRWWEANLSTDPKMSRLTFVLETFDLDALYAGAIPLARALDTAVDNLSNLDADGSVHADWQTPLGRIAVGGKGKDTYAGAYALVIDLGGNDVYRGPGAASGQDGVALVLDLGGDDRYVARDSAEVGPGGAVLGYAGIVDAGTGKDAYEATSWAGGFGFLGVGWIDDRGGDDTYRMQLLSQGSALFGIGMLLDEQGDDQFTLSDVDPAFTNGQAQGFGGPWGAGVLIDLTGNDTYTSMTSVGFIQGASWNGSAKWAGGVGLLLDGGGDDDYLAYAVHNAQGSANGSGLGVLSDLSGADTYSAVDLSQGSGERFGLGILYDREGSDHYQAHCGAMGYGGDFGMGMLVEGSGNDAYESPFGTPCPDKPSLAAASSQGAGWLLDLEGNDTYPGPGSQVISGATLPWRAPVPGVGVFIDAGQPDTKETYSPCTGNSPARGGTLILPVTNGAMNASPSSP